MNILLSYDGDKPVFEFIVDPTEDCALDCGAFASSFVSYFFNQRTENDQETNIQKHPECDS